MTAHEYADGLRQVAAWYDAHPDAPMSSGEIFVADHTFDLKMARWVVRMFGTAEKEWLPSSLIIKHRFGAVTLSFAFSRSAVCTQHVVGTRVVPARPATPESVEDVIEWQCDPVLAREVTV